MKSLSSDNDTLRCFLNSLSTSICIWLLMNYDVPYTLAGKLLNLFNSKKTWMVEN